MTERDLPQQADTIVVGGGTAGAVVAGLLVEKGSGSVLLLEAGPDYGAFVDGRWPADVCDARALSETHDWGYHSEETYPDRRVTFERARIMGGCSSHNGCAAIWGSRLDYDGWAAAGNEGWSTDELVPIFKAVSQRLHVHIPDPRDATPFQAAWVAAAPAAGIPRVADLNDLDEDVGIGLSPVNIHDGVRWNTAFAYLDPVRDRPELTIRGEVLVDRVVVDGGRATGVVAIGPEGAVTIRAERVVVAAGAYGSPAVLLRSGIGNPGELVAIGIAPVHDLPGVGRNLHDHPRITIIYRGTSELEARMTAFGERSWMPEEQAIAKARSSGCREGFDLHLFPVGGPKADTESGWAWAMPVACMTPQSRGSLSLRSADPEVAPVIDHRYLSDIDGADRRVLADGLAIARRMAAQPEIRDLLGPESDPGPAIASATEIDAWVDRTCLHYYHPVGTCKLGPATDPEAVVDARGKVHGVDGLYVADAAIMPVIPRANTNIPAAVVGARIAEWLRA